MSGTNPRNRNLATITSTATQPASLPGLIKPRTGDAALDRWIGGVQERLEVREGRSNKFEQVVTRRDLVNLGVATVQQVMNPQVTPTTVPADTLGGAGSGIGGTPLTPDHFEETIRGLKLYTDLLKRIDDPTRFDDLPAKVRALLLPDIAAIDGTISAYVRRSDESISSAQESFASSLVEVRASVAKAAAGVRSVRWASANENRATAGLVTTVTARLDNFSGGAPGTATVESKMTAIADRATGLEAQYTLKVSAGGAMAGFGIAATTNVSGNATSAFIIQANKFAIVSSSYAGGLTNTPPASAIMFGTDSDGAYVGGNLKVTGKALIDGTATLTAGINSALGVNGSLTQTYGVHALSNVSGAAGLLGAGSNGANGVIGATTASGTGAAGVRGNASGAGNYGVYAFGGLSAAALYIDGACDIRAANYDTGTATATFVSTNKPGGNSSNEWVRFYKAGVSGRIPWWPD